MATTTPVTRNTNRTLPVGDRVVASDSIHYTEDDLQHVIVMNQLTGDFYGLDDSAAVIWRTLVTSGSVQAAVDAITNAYGIETSSAQNDVRAFVAELAAAGLVSVE